MHLPIEPPFGKPPQRDAFGSQQLADRLASLVYGVKPPYAISISGEWGIGKTTLMHQMLAALRKLGGEPLAVELDLWSEDIDDLRRAIAIEVGAVSKKGTDLLAVGGKDAAKARRETAEELDKSVRGTVSSPELSSDLQRNLLRPGRWLAVLTVGALLAAFFYASANLSKPWDALALSMIPVIVTSAVIMAGLALGITTTSRSIAPAAEKVGLGRELRSLVSTQDDERTVVVVIDNLDRLSGKDALKTLGEIRSFIEIPDGRCVFVIPIDRDAFIRHCQPRGMEADVSSDYLQKFFNLNVLLTKPVPLDLRKWTLGLVEECIGPGADRVQVAEIIADAADGSPRSVTRILSGSVARYKLLSKDSLASITFPQIAFVEALVTAFPFVVRAAGLAPRVLVAARETLASSTDDQTRANAVTPLSSDEPVAPSPAERSRLMSFLLTNRSVRLDEDQIRLILSLREDRDWQGIGQPDALRSALRTGDADAFALDLAAREDRAREQIVSRAMDLVEHECRSGWTTGAINGLNALVPSLGLEAGIDDLRDDARQLLASARDQVAGMSVDAVRFACGGAVASDPRLRDAVAWAASVVRGRKDGPTPDPTSCLELMRLMAPDMPASQLSDVRESLATRSDAELAALFVPGEHVRHLLDGPVIERDFDLICKWDPSADNQIPQMGPSLDRVLFVKPYGIVLKSDRLNELVTRLSGAVVTATVNWSPCFEKLTRLLADQPASDTVDTFASAWSAWPANRGFGLRLALSLPLQDPTQARLSEAARVWMLTAGHDEVASLARSIRDSHAQLVRDAIADRWVSTGDLQDADLAAEAGEDGIAALVERLDALPPASGQFPTFAQQAVEVVLARRSASGAALLVTSFARFLNAATAATVSGFAMILTRLCQLEIDGKSYSVDVGPILACIEAKLSAAAESDLPLLAAGAKNFDDQHLDPSGGLATVAARRSRELQSIDWSTAEWLANRSTKKSDVVDAIVSAIRRQTEPIQAVIPRFAALKKSLRASPRIAEAVLPAVAVCPGDEIEGLLRQMDGWNRPKRPDSAYSEAQRRIAIDHPGLLDKVGFQVGAR
jgi:hypothetical protein